MIQKFKKKPIVIEAVQYTGKNDNEILKFAKPTAYLNILGIMMIETLEGNHEVTEKDWVIKGIKGEFYPCKPDIFEATYDVNVGEGVA